jgi:selenocysteine lyase/cysteine desulfurase
LQGSSQWADQYPISAYGSPIYYDDDETFTGVSASDGSDQLVCRGLDHADSQGLNKTNLRLRYLINWLVISLLKLCHPSQGEEEGSPLVHIYGPEVKYDRGGSVAFNIFDRTGALVNPGLVQRLADRNNISLGLGTLCNIVYPDRPVHLLDSGVLEPGFNLDSNMEGKSGNDEQDWPSRIPVVTAALGFVSNFEDVYRLWSFVAQFLDADFVSREGWRYYSLNQEMVF